MTRIRPLLTTGQALDRLRGRGVEVHRNTLAAWVRSGLLPATRTPTGRFLFRTEDIDALCDQPEVAA